MHSLRTTSLASFFSVVMTNMTTRNLWEEKTYLVYASRSTVQRETHCKIQSRNRGACCLMAYSQAWHRLMLSYTSSITKNNPASNDGLEHQ